MICPILKFFKKWSNVTTPGSETALDTMYYYITILFAFYIIKQGAATLPGSTKWLIEDRIATARESRCCAIKYSSMRYNPLSKKHIAFKLIWSFIAIL
jgi:hypothetical protein